MANVAGLYILEHLFAREIRHEPRRMLKDLTTLYQLHYGLTEAEAKKMIRKDTKEVQLFG